MRNMSDGARNPHGSYGACGSPSLTSAPILKPLPSRSSSSSALHPTARVLFWHSFAPSADGLTAHNSSRWIGHETAGFPCGSTPQHDPHDPPDRDHAQRSDIPVDGIVP